MESTSSKSLSPVHDLDAFGVLHRCTKSFLSHADSSFFCLYVVSIWTQKHNPPKNFPKLPKKLLSPKNNQSSDVRLEEKSNEFATRATCALRRVAPHVGPQTVVLTSKAPQVAV
jgi:hypothetical protein